MTVMGANNRPKASVILDPDIQTTKRYHEIRDST